MQVLQCSRLQHIAILIISYFYIHFRSHNTTLSKTILDGTMGRSKGPSDCQGKSDFPVTWFFAKLQTHLTNFWDSTFKAASPWRLSLWRILLCKIMELSTRDKIWDLVIWAFSWERLIFIVCWKEFCEGELPKKLGCELYIKQALLW